MGFLVWESGFLYGVACHTNLPLFFFINKRVYRGKETKNCCNELLSIEVIETDFHTPNILMLRWIVLNIITRRSYSIETINSFVESAGRDAPRTVLECKSTIKSIDRSESLVFLFFLDRCVHGQSQRSSPIADDTGHCVANVSSADEHTLITT